MSAARAVAVALVTLIGGCATQLERQALPYKSPVIEVAPGAPYQRCVRLLAGEHLFFSYQVDPPMSFAIRRQSGATTLSFVLREAGREDSGVFLVAQTADYCVHWDAVNADAPWPSLLRFDLRVTPAPP